MSLAKSASLRQIETFRTVARLGNLSAAGEELHLSQSAVSIQISSLEASIGASIVTRTGRGVKLTEAGELLLVYANRLIALWNETSDEMATFVGAFSGTLRVGAVTSAEYWLPKVLVNFLGVNSKVKVKLHVANRDEIVRSLAAEEIDIAVMGRVPDDFAVEWSRIGSNPVAFVVAPGHRLLAVADLTMARLSQERLLLRERGSGSRTTVERLFKDAGLQLRVGSELSSNEAIKQMCLAGFGPAYLSMHTCMLELNAGVLTMLSLPNNPVQRDWHVVRVAGRTLPQVALAFERMLIETAEAETLLPLEQYLSR